MPIVLLLFPLGIVVGILASVLGIGGGLVMVPVLNILGATPLQSTATSLIGIFLGAASATTQNYQNQNLNVKVVILLAIPALFTTELGVRLASILPARYLLILFTVFLVGSIFLIDLKKKLPDSPGEKVVLTIKKIWPIQGIGAIAGILSGLLGVGGGLVMVPLQMTVLGETIKDAIRTSLGAISFISLWGATSHALKGNVLWQEGLLLGMGSVIGGQIGAKLLPKIPDRVVKNLFRGLLVLMSIYMGVKAWMS